MRWYLVAVVLAAISCKARVYTPCDLARTFKFYYSSYIPEKYVPLAVCIAGYHNYSKSNELRHPDGRIFYGYFGLIAEPDECPEDILTDDAYFSGDWKCLKSQVIDVPEKMKLYEKLCGPKLANSITCRFNEYFDFAEVLDPIHKDIFALSFGEEKIIDRILSSYNTSDDHDMEASTNIELHNMTSSSDVSSRDTRGVAPEPHPHNETASQETNHDKTTPIHGVQEYKETKKRAMERIDDVSCFTAPQITTVICTTLLAQTLLIIAVFYFLTKLKKNRTEIREAPEFKFFSPPTAPLPSMDDYARKSFPGGPS